MSYDITFRVKAEGIEKWLEVGYCDANITWNVYKIIVLSTGLPWKNEANNGLCSEVMPAIAKGLHELEANPKKYKPYEAENGWGTVEGTVRFFKQILRAWRELEREEPQLAQMATFWIG